MQDPEPCVSCIENVRWLMLSASVMTSLQVQRFEFWVWGFEVYVAAVTSRILVGSWVLITPLISLLITYLGDFGGI